MTKQQLLEAYIKKAVRKKLAEEAQLAAKREKSVYMIYKFPGLKKVFVDLMSPAFPRFIKGVQIIAPKPTTFLVTLSNDMEFYVYYANKGKFIAKISGKKYHMSDMNDVNRGSQAITNLLELNYNTEEVSGDKSIDSPEGGDAPGGGGDMGGGGGMGSMGASDAQRAADLKAALDGAGPDTMGDEAPGEPGAAGPSMAGAGDEDDLEN